MRVLCVDHYGGDGLLDFVLRCQRAGHEVKWHFKKTDRTDCFGKGLVADIVNDWREWMRWADLVVLADNTHYLKEMDAWRKEGIPIVGATVESASWELDRKCGMDIFKRAGIEIPNFKEFTNCAAAIKYVEKEDRGFVSKPCYDEADKNLTYLGKRPELLIAMLRRWEREKRLKGPFILQELVSGIEMAVGGWFGPHGFNDGWLVNWEEKKLMAGGIGPSCFTPDAEVLTLSGWKYWPDVTMDDEICTLKEGRIVYDKPSQVVVADFDGELIGWLSPTVDFIVTPGHNLYVQDDHHRKPFFFEQAFEVEGKRRAIARGGGCWDGERPLLADTEAHAALLGIYIADGNCHKGQVVFGNCPPHKRAQFKEIIHAAGYGFSDRADALCITSQSLVNAFSDYGLAHEKFVPRHIKSSTPSVIEAFLAGYGAGDGDRRDTSIVFTTTSLRLANDLQELLLKVGRGAVIRTRDRRGESHDINGYLCVNRRIAYDVGTLPLTRLKAEISPETSYRQAYKGKVYCVTVPSHVIYVRRNGKPCWSGQTGEMGTTMQHEKKSKLADKVLKPLEALLEQTGHIGYVDVNCIIDEKGQPWPLEFTMRNGYPCFNIQQDLHDGDPAEWLLDLAEGRDAKVVRYDEVAVGVVMSQGDFPWSKLASKEIIGFPIYGLDEVDGVHLAQAMAGDAPFDIEGKFIEAPCVMTAGDYLLIACGTGDTVRAARKGAYKTLDTIKMPNSPGWRIDIGQRLAKELPILHKLGYALGLEF